MKTYVEPGDIWKWKYLKQNVYLLVMEWDMYDDSWKCLRLSTGMIDNWLIDIDDPVNLKHWEYIA